MLSLIIIINLFIYLLVIKVTSDPIDGVNNNITGIKIAFCLTGQLARLELLSKIANVFIPNIKIGNIPHVYLYLDNEIDDIKQTYWTFNYSTNLYGNYTSNRLKDYIDFKLLRRFGYTNVDIRNIKTGQMNLNYSTNIHNLRVRVKLAPPSRDVFHVVNDKVPVKAKAFSGHDGPRTNFESAESRFQNNMRWMSGLRDCVKWVQQIEYEQQWHYDLVIRLRDDSYALGTWLINKDYLNHLTSLKTGSFRGINDHNLVVDRKYADTLLRGLTEDYYFNSTLENEHWGNAEHRIFMVATSYNIPLRTVSICEQPLIPLRGLLNATHWRLHPLYVRHFTEDCKNTFKYDNHISNNIHFNVSCCPKKWFEIFENKCVPTNENSKLLII